MPGLWREIWRQVAPEYFATAIAALAKNIPFDFTSYQTGIDGSCIRCRLHVVGKVIPDVGICWSGYMAEVLSDDTTIVEEDCTSSGIDVPEPKQLTAIPHMLVGGVSQSQELILLTDAEGAILFMNPAFVLLSGHEEWRGHNMNVDKLLPEKTVRFFKEQGWFPDGQVEYLHQDGSSLPVEQSSTVVYENGEVVNHIIVGRDLTKHRACTRKLDELAYYQQIGELTAAVAHDLKNILQALYIFGECLQERTKGTCNAKALIEACESASSMVFNVLSYGHLSDEKKDEILKQLQERG